MSYSSLFLHHRRFIILSALAVMAAVLAVCFIFFPLKYSATTRLLVLPKSSIGVDAYTAVKSAERVSENLAQIIYTTSFFEKVTKAGFNLDTGPFNVSEINKRKLWQKTVLPQALSGTALLSVTVFHQDKEQATNWASAIGYVLQTQGFEYTGGNVDIKIVDTPVLSRFPVQPNFLMNGLLGLIFGAILGGAYVLFRYE